MDDDKIENAVVDLIEMLIESCGSEPTEQSVSESVAELVAASISAARLLLLFGLRRIRPESQRKIMLRIFTESVQSTIESAEKKGCKATKH